MVRKTIKAIAFIFAIILTVTMLPFSVSAESEGREQKVAIEWMRSSEDADSTLIKKIKRTDDAFTYKEVINATPLRYFQTESAKNKANTRAASGNENVYAAASQKVGDQFIWDCGNYFTKYREENGNVSYKWASWEHFGKDGSVDINQDGDYSIRRFSSYFDLSSELYYGLNSAVLAPEDELGNMSYLFPINDTLFIYVNGQLAYWGGTDLVEGRNTWGALNRTKFMGRDGLKVRNGVNHMLQSVYPHTDGWCIDIEKDLEYVDIKSLLKVGENRIDVIADEYWEGGGMNKLNLFCNVKPDIPTIETDPTYIVFVVDATSSMGGVDLLGNTTSRFTVSQQAIQKYLDTLYSGPYTNVEKHLALVSFGNGARVHVTAADAAGKFNGLAQTSVEYCAGGGTDKVTDNYIGTGTYGVTNAADALAKYNQITDKKSLFYNSRAELTSMVANITKYSNTNAESGLLLAKSILDGVPANSNKLIVFITDGESAASSTFFSYYNETGAAEKIMSATINVSGSNKVVTYNSINETLKDADYTAAGVTSSTAIGSYTAKQANALKLRALARNTAFFNEITKNLTINPFAGEWHDYDRLNSDSSKTRVSASPDYTKVIDVNGYYWSKGRINSPANYYYFMKDKNFKKVSGEWNFSANGGSSYTAVWADPLFKMSAEGKSIQELVYNNSAHELMIFATDEKIAETRMIDYYESTSKNSFASAAAKDFMVKAATSAKASGIDIQAIGVGGLVLLPEYLNSVDSAHSAIVADSNSVDPVNMLARKILEFTNGAFGV